MDISDLVKRHLANMHRAPINTKTVEDRKETLMRERQSKRHCLARLRRNIDNDMSPYRSPLRSPKVKKTPQVQPVSINEVCSKRLEMLAVWKEQRAKQKKIEKAKEKPAFRCGNVSYNLSSLDNLDTIKGKPIPKKSSQFAPENHKFRPPSNIKPFKFGTPKTSSISLTGSKQTPKPLFPFVTRSKQTHGTPKPPTERVKSKPVKKIDNKNWSVSKLPSEAVAVTRSVARNKVGPVTPKPTTKHISSIKQPARNEVETLTQAPVSKHKDTRITQKSETQVSTKNKQTNSDIKKSKVGIHNKKTRRRSTERESKQALSEKKVEEAVNVSNGNKQNRRWSIKKEVNEVEKDIAVKDETPRTPVYISPFVTISRGKSEARKEYTIRQSFSEGQQLLKNTPKIVSLLNEHTSPKAGAEYFTIKLDMEIARLQSIAKKWETYLHSDDVVEEAKSSISAALGQSNLLITKKFEQFRDLINQCKTRQYEEKVITCQDLHGFWDMIYIQVEDMDKRFANLDRLKENNWIEMLPEKKAPAKKGKGRSKKAAASSRIKDMIKAARERQKTDEFGLSRVCTSTPNKRKSLRVAELAVQSKPRCSSSPGLTMMKISQSIKQNNGLTPAKGILRTDNCKSTGKKSVAFKESSSPKQVKKTLLFPKEEDDVFESADDASNKENEMPINSLRRSSRLLELCK